MLLPSLSIKINFMNSIIMIFLTLPTFLIAPLLHAQTIRVTPTAPSGITTPMAAPAGLPQWNALSFGLGSPKMDIGGTRLLSPLPGTVLPSISLPANKAAHIPTKDMHGTRTAPAALESPSALMASVQAGFSEGKDATKERTADLRSLRAVGDQHKPAKELTAEKLFDGTEGKAEPKEWTFMVFLNGHNNLDRFSTLNIKQMENVGSNDRVNIVVQWASLDNPTRRMLIQRSESGEVTSPVIESLPPVDMGSADQFFEFIRWTVERFPAQHYMVDIWNHGLGWRFSPDKLSSPMDISWDDLTHHHITTEQVGEVMRKVKTLIGRPIDILGFDACLMAMAEVVGEVMDSVRYVAGSEQTEPGAGWPYDKVLRQWLAAPPDDGAALLKALTEQFVAAYKSDVTFSGLDARKFPAFAQALKSLSREIVRLEPGELAKVRNASRETQRYAVSEYGDFLDFILKLAKTPIKGLSSPVLNEVISTYRAVVVASAASADLARSNGMSIWLPTRLDTWQDYGKRYLGLIWHRLSEWGHAVKRLSGAS